MEVQTTQSPQNNRIPMKDELFQQLAASLKEGGAILRGKKKPARSTTLQWPDAKVVREKLGLSQSQFVALISISPRTLTEDPTTDPPEPLFFCQFLDRRKVSAHKSSPVGPDPEQASCYHSGTIPVDLPY
jgi:DNA-binding transcriptional regulator YiaG